jgi:hypothetical protein
MLSYDSCIRLLWGSEHRAVRSSNVDFEKADSGGKKLDESRGFSLHQSLANRKVSISVTPSYQVDHSCHLATLA